LSVTQFQSFMHISNFDYHLPPELIAQKPADRRDLSRLLVVNRERGAFEDSIFRRFPDLLDQGDVLVINNTRVFPARLIGNREGSGGRVEVFLLREVEPFLWEALVKPGRALRQRARVRFGDGRLRAEIVDYAGEGRRLVRLEAEGDLEELIDRFGQAPLPPYIKRDSEKIEESDAERYQTIYARERGSIAAPTAGLHFTEEIIDQIKARGIEVVELTHHVGYATFQPVRVEQIEEHKIEAEIYTIPQSTSEAINRAKDEGRRVIAVGTTTTRALESAATNKGKVKSGSGLTELFIYPGYEFRLVDCLLTNFHLPRSSLLMLVSALAGRELIMRAYEHAVKERYRFYSYGDCMFIS